jgi:hypothetical protein
VLLAEQRDAAAAASALLQHHRHWRAAQPRLYSTLLPLLHRLLADAAVLLGDTASTSTAGTSGGAAAAPLHISTGSSSSGEGLSRHDQRHLDIRHQVSCMYFNAVVCALSQHMLISSLHCTLADGSTLFPTGIERVAGSDVCASMK